MKLLFYSIKQKKLIKYKWNELEILENLLNNKIRLPKIIDNKIITEDYINNLKIKISKLENYIPLYNINIRNIQIISKNLIFEKIKKDKFRFPDNNIIKNIKSEIINLKNTERTPNLDIFYKKLIQSYNFLKNFDLDLLENSYIRMIYFGSKTVGKDITTYEKISYLPFIPDSIPYYSRSELINMGLNFGDINPDNRYYNEELLYSLYKKVIKNDFSADFLLKNLHYINKEDCISLVRYYTFHGSHYMNSYLRDNNNIKNKSLENIILKLWKLILNSPTIKSNKIVYRFIDDDFFLKHLKIGDIYQDKGFISTTRNQFYDVDSEKFGYILLKINLPKNSKGCLCVEPYSLFKDEEEVILPPLAKLQLINKDDNVKYYHIKDTNEDKIVKRYEFNYKNSIINNSILKKKIENIKSYDLLKFIIKGKSLSEKINYFYNNLNNKFNKFYLIIENKKYLFNCDFYDSYGLYSKFFTLKVDKGFYIYNLNIKGQYEYIIEFGKQLHVNYFMKFDNDNLDIYNKHFLKIIAIISYAFKIKNIIIYSRYQYNNFFIKNKKINQDKNLNFNSAYITTYNYDIYQYLKFNKKRFNNSYITEMFNYYYLDLLFKINIEEILNKDDQDNLFNIFKNYYKHNDNIGDFYIFINEKYWYLINEFNNKLKILFKKFNQEFLFTYLFDIYHYLIEKKIIKSIENYKKSKKLNKDLVFINIHNKFYKKKLRSIEY